MTWKMWVFDDYYYDEDYAVYYWKQNVLVPLSNFLRSPSRYYLCACVRACVRACVCVCSKFKSSEQWGHKILCCPCRPQCHCGYHGFWIVHAVAPPSFPRRVRDVHRCPYKGKWSPLSRCSWALLTNSRLHSRLAHSQGRNTWNKLTALGLLKTKQKA